MAASTYAACLTGRIAYDTPTTVFNKGGLVRAEAGTDGMVTLSGNATVEWSGSVTVDLESDEPGARDLVITQRHDEEIAAWETLRNPM
jgi:diaminopimelate epimerase